MEAFSVPSWFNRYAAHPNANFSAVDGHTIRLLSRVFESSHIWLIPTDGLGGAAALPLPLPPRPPAQPSVPPPAQPNCSVAVTLSQVDTLTATDVLQLLEGGPQMSEGELAQLSVWARWAAAQEQYKDSVARQLFGTPAATEASAAPAPAPAAMAPLPQPALQPAALPMPVPVPVGHASAEVRAPLGDRTNLPGGQTEPAKPQCAKDAKRLANKMHVAAARKQAPQATPEEVAALMKLQLSAKEPLRPTWYRSSPRSRKASKGSASDGTGVFVPSVGQPR